MSICSECGGACIECRAIGRHSRSCCGATICLLADIPKARPKAKRKKKKAAPKKAERLIPISLPEEDQLETTTKTKRSKTKTGSR